VARHHWLLGGLLLGILAGAFLHPYSDQPGLAYSNQTFLQPIGQIFLRLIFVTVVPLVFSALVLGVYELGKSRGLGKIARQAIFYTVLASTVSVLVGITSVNLLRPGAQFTLDTGKLQGQSSSLLNLKKSVSEAKSLSQAIVELIPNNPVDTAAKALGGEMLPFMVFSFLFGLALSRVLDPHGPSPVIIQFLEQLLAVSMKMIDFALRIAPVGIFAIVFNTVFLFGVGIIQTLFYFVAVVVAGLLFQQFVVYTVLLKYIARYPPWEFFRRCREVYLYAFSTASSNATLPLTLEIAQRELRLPSTVSRFVLTVGATANQNGTALFEGVTVLFLAQVYGVDLSLFQQIQVVFMSILAGIGTAGVPGGSLPLIMILLQTVGIPPEGIGLILGADRFLDMCRTTLNVSGDLVIAALVSKSSQDDQKSEDPNDASPRP